MPSPHPHPHVESVGRSWQGVSIPFQHAEEETFDGFSLMSAYSAHHDRPDRRIVITQIGDGDHRSERSDVSCGGAV
jgi:hypothetical protein